MAVTILLCYSDCHETPHVYLVVHDDLHLEYGVSEADMRRLYENAKRDQWNASRDIPGRRLPRPTGA